MYMCVYIYILIYSKVNVCFQGAVGTNITIKVLCSVMLDSSLGEPYDRYAAVARLMQSTFSQPCINTQYKSYIQDMSNTSWSGPEAGGGVCVCVCSCMLICVCCVCYMCMWCSSLVFQLAALYYRKSGLSFVLFYVFVFSFCLSVMYNPWMRTNICDFNTKCPRN